VTANAGTAKAGTANTVTANTGTANTGAVSADAVKLTSYFGERRRVAGNGFAADALLDLYGRHQVATSILLRGAEGFGARRHPRTDRSLTLSEDLPLIAVAVDTRSRMEPLVELTAQITGTGLVTVERACLLNGAGGAGDIDPGDSSTGDSSTGDSSTGDSSTGGGLEALRDGVHEETKLTIYLGRQERVDRVPAFVAVCDLLHRRGVAGATALLGVDGTAHGQRQRAAFFSRNAATPLMVIAVGAGERIGRVLPELGGLLRRPLVTLERVRICKRDGELLCLPPSVVGDDDPASGDSAAAASGLRRWQKLMVYTSESALHAGQPVYREIVRRLRAAGISGATTQRGMWGFHGDHRPHGDRLLQLGRHVPVVTIVIDSPERIAAAFAVVNELTAEGGLVTCETIPVMRPGGAAVR
jgi:PII-like signaling protein